MSRTDDGISLLAAAALGALVGAAVGVLFAPAKGEVTRKKIKKGVAKLKEDLEDEAIDFKEERIDPVVEDIKDKVSGVVNSKKNQ